MKYLCFETRTVTPEYFLDKMQFYEGFEIMKGAAYVDVYQRLMLRDIAYILLQKGSKNKINREKTWPLPFDKVKIDDNHGDFNEGWLKDYDKKMEEYDEKAAKLIERNKKMEYKNIDIQSLIH